MWCLKTGMKSLSVQSDPDTRKTRSEQGLGSTAGSCPWYFSLMPWHGTVCVGFGSGLPKSWWIRTTVSSRLESHRRPLSLTTDQTLPGPPLSHVPKHHISMLLGALMIWWWGGCIRGDFRTAVCVDRMVWWECTEIHGQNVVSWGCDSEGSP